MELQKRSHPPRKQVDQVGFNLLVPWMSVQSSIAIHVVIVDISVQTKMDDLAKHKCSYWDIWKHGRQPVFSPCLHRVGLLQKAEDRQGDICHCCECYSTVILPECLCEAECRANFRVSHNGATHQHILLYKSLHSVQTAYIHCRWLRDTSSC